MPPLSPHQRTTLFPALFLLSFRIMDLSANAEFLATAHYQMLLVWDLRENLQVASYPGNYFSESLIKFIPGTQILAFRTSYNKIQLIDWKSQRILSSLVNKFTDETIPRNSFASFYLKLQFSSVHKPQPPSLLANKPLKLAPPIKPPPLVLFWSPYIRLTLGGSAKTLQLHSAKTRRKLRTIEINYFSSKLFSLPLNGGSLATISQDRKEFQIVDLTKAEVFTFQYQISDFATSLAIACNGQVLAAGHANGLIQIWNVKLRQQVRFLKWAQQAIHFLIFHPDGYRLFSQDSQFETVLWDVQTGVQLQLFIPGLLPITAYDISAAQRKRNIEAEAHVLDSHLYPRSSRIIAHCASITCLAVSKDGTTLASGDDAGFLIVWEVSTGREVQSIKTGAQAVVLLEFCPDGHPLLFGGGPDINELWNIRTGQQLLRFDNQSCLCFHPSGREIITINRQSRVFIWDITQRSVVRQLQLPYHDAQQLGLVMGGYVFITWAQYSGLQLWDSRSGRRIRKSNYKIHSRMDSKICSFRLSPRGNLVACSCTSTLHIRAANSLKLLRVVRLDKKQHAINFNNDGTRLAVIQYNQSVEIWDLAAGKALLSSGNTVMGDKAIVFTGDSKQFVMAGHQKILKVYDTENGALANQIGDKPLLNQDLIYTMNGKRLAYVEKGNQLSLWENQTKVLVLTLKGHRDFITSFACSLDGNQLASGSADGTLMFWNGSSGECVRAIQSDYGPPLSIAYAPNGKSLAISFQKNRVEILNQLLTVVYTLPGSFDRLTFSKNSARLLLLDQSCQVKLVDLATKKAGASLLMANGNALETKLSPDDALIAIPLFDGRILLHTFTDQIGKQVSSFGCHTKCLSFSPCVSLLVSGCRDNLIRVWQVPRGDFLYAIPGHRLCVAHVAFSPDGLALASCSIDNVMIEYELGKYLRRQAAERKGATFSQIDVKQISSFK